MKKAHYLIFLVVLLMNSPYLLSQQIRVISFETLETMIHKPNDTTYIVNFFASWCAPCVKELPEFIVFEKEYKSEKTQVFYVSLDFKKDYKKKIGPLSIRLNLGQNVYLLDEPNANNWINKIDSTWSGGIPATLFINAKKNYKHLFNQSFIKELLVKTFKSIAE